MDNNFTKRKKIIHLVTPYLFHTGSWIYSQLTFSGKYEHIVFTQRIKNLELFPYKHIYSPRNFGFYKKLFNRLYRRVTQKYGLYFRPLVNALNPLVFHAHFGNEAVYWLPFVKSFHLPLVTTFYGYDVSQLGKIPKWRRKYKDLFEYGTIFLAEGPYLKKQLMDLGCHENKIVVQPLGVAVAEYPTKRYDVEKQDSRIIILQVSTFREKKGIAYSLKAISQLIKTYPDIEFRLIGDGDGKSQRQKVHQMVLDLNISHCVKLLGIKSHYETIQEMISADIFLHPSVTAKNGDNEGGAPVSVIEASAVGLPVVSTFHADIPEVVINRETGLLAPERDSEQLSMHLLELIQNPKLKYQFGKAGRTHVLRHYNLDIQVKKLQQIYDRFSD